MRHGRAVMPFGKYKGVRIRLLPDDYLSWMTTILKDTKWKWLKDSLVSELRFRGLRHDLADTTERNIRIDNAVMELKPRRAVSLVDV